MRIANRPWLTVAGVILAALVCLAGLQDRAGGAGSGFHNSGQKTDISVQAPKREVDTGLIAADSRWETRWYITEAPEDGPTVLVTGGVHGNEPAGARAARQIQIGRASCRERVYCEV